MNKKANILLIAFFLFYSCNNKVQSNDWSFEIKESKVGNISTYNLISEIQDLLPKDYTIKRIKSIYENEFDDTEAIMYVVMKDDKAIFHIIPKVDDNKAIYSIVILCSKYQISNTNIRVGSKVAELKNSYTIKNYYFNISDGLYIFCDDFNGAFSINKNETGDTFNSIEDLSDNYQISSIVIY